MRSPPPSPLIRPVSTGQLLRTGCLGFVLGTVLTLGALLFAALWTAYVGPLPALKTDPSQADITITMQEAYFKQVIAQTMPALPSGLATEVQLDLQPGNRLAFRSRLKSTLLGQNLGGDVSGTVILEARDGQMAIRFGDVKVLGFALPAIGQTLMNEFSVRLSQTINDQVKAGLGQNAYIMSLTSDDRQMTIQARWE